MTESEDALHSADEILREGMQNTTPIEVRISPKTARTIADVMGSQYINDQESNSVSRRFEEALASQQNQTSAESTQLIPVLISGRELDLYNKYYGPEFWPAIDGNNEALRIATSMFKPSPEQLDKAIARNNELHLDFKSELVGAYIDLNLSSIRAGR